MSKPRVITLCGSTRFRDTFHRVNAALTVQGYIVISLGVFGKLDMPDLNWETDATPLKSMLDELHKRKIDLCDEIYVINVNGYIGESTRNEIAYAREQGKGAQYLEPPCPKCAGAVRRRSEAGWRYIRCQDCGWEFV